MAGILLLMLCCCLCISCCSLLCRLRCKKSEQVNWERDSDIVSENASRQSGQRRRQPAPAPPRLTREERAAQRQKAHDELIEKYKKLIPTIKYKKNKDIDEFGATDCVICMEEFVNGASIRKIPSCRHIFHPECLMKWLSGPNQMEE